MEITAKRIIAWSSNTDITLANSDKIYKEKFFLSLIKQSNFLSKNLNNLLDFRILTNFWSKSLCIHVNMIYYGYY